MILKKHRVSRSVCLKALAGSGLVLGLISSPSFAQNPFSPAPAGAVDAINETAAPSASAVGRAREKVDSAGPSAGDLMSAQLGRTAMRGAGVRDASKAVQRVVIPRVKAIVGTRVFDAVTGELLDDAQLVNIDQAEIQNMGLVDDGSQGDRLPEDGEFAKVDQSREYIGQANQRLKERLIQAIYSAEQLNPLDFYGFNIMTTERSSPAPRSRRWRLVKDPDGGPGKTLAEVATEKPLEVPKYREWEMERDRKVAGKDGWAIRFLDEYRTDKGNIDSEFYTIYIPQPPVVPTVPPPPGWNPFPNPAGADPNAVPGGAGFSAQGFKIKAPPGGAPGGGAQPYFDKGATDKMFR